MQPAGSWTRCAGPLRRPAQHLRRRRTGAARSTWTTWACSGLRSMKGARSRGRIMDLNWKVGAGSGQRDGAGGLPFTTTDVAAGSAIVHLRSGAGANGLSPTRAFGARTQGELSAMRAAYARHGVPGTHAIRRSTIASTSSANWTCTTRTSPCDAQARRPAHGPSDNVVIGYRHATGPDARQPVARGAAGDGRVDGQSARRPGPRHRVEQAGPRGRRLHSTPGRRDRPRHRRLGAASSMPARGRVHQRFPLYSTSRIVAGAPIEGGSTSARSSRSTRRWPTARTLLDASAAEAARLRQSSPTASAPTRARSGRPATPPILIVAGRPGCPGRPPALAPCRRSACD
jgi:hypothetical protein